MTEIDYRITLNDSYVVKCIAICAMLWHHLFLDHQELGAASFRLALVGKICVALFIFISGYGMSTKFPQIIKDNLKQTKITSVIKFIARRLVKFYFNYWLVFILVLPLGIILFNRQLSNAYGTNADIWFYLCRDFFGFGSLESYNVTWWFNRLIIVLWLFFPMLYWSMNSKFVSIPMLVLLYLNPSGILKPLNSLAPGLSTYMVVFATGIFMAIHIKRINVFFSRINPYVVCGSLLAITFTLLYMRNIRVTPYFIGKSIDPFASIFITLTVACLRNLTNHTLIKPMAFIGQHSMNMYLTHTFVFCYFFSDFIYSAKHPLLIFLLLFSISLFLSIVIEFFKRKTCFYKLLDKTIDLLK